MTQIDIYTFGPQVILLLITFLTLYTTFVDKIGRTLYTLLNLRDLKLKHLRAKTRKLENTLVFYQFRRAEFYMKAFLPLHNKKDARWSSLTLRKRAVGKKG